MDGVDPETGFYDPTAQLSDTATHGYRSCDLPVQTSIDATTMFALSRNDELGRRSYGTRYDDLSADAKNQALSIMQVGTMAYREKWQYAPSSHSHGDRYSFTSVDVTYGESSDGTTQFIGQLSVSDMAEPAFSPEKYDVVDIYCPVIPSPIPPEPPVGTLRFIWRPAADVRVFDDAYVASDDFDGWLYPNGKTYRVNADQFTFGKNKFVTNPENPYLDAAAGTLTVPCLSDFIRLNPNSYLYNADASRKVDIIFYIDTTGSMGRVRDALKTKVSQFVHNLSLRTDYSEDISADWRIGCASFGDYTCDSPWLMTTGMLSDANSLQEKIADLGTTGGGDQPETPFSAIYCSLVTDDNVGPAGSKTGPMFEFRADVQKILIIFTDAPYKCPTHIVNSVVDYIKENNVQTYIYLHDLNSQWQGIEERISASIFQIGQKYYGEDGNLLSGDLMDQLLDSVAYNFNKKTVVTRRVNSVFDRISAHTVVPAHSHPLTKLAFSAKLRVNQDDSRLKCGPNWVNYQIDGCHAGTGSSSVKYFPAEFNYNAGYVKFKTEATGEPLSAIETHPAYDTMPVQVYVGGRKKEYERVFF